MWSGGRSAATNGLGSYFAASAVRSTAACPASASGTGPMVRICLSDGTFSSRPSARSTNIGFGSMISDVTSASDST